MSKKIINMDYTLLLVVFIAVFIHVNGRIFRASDNVPVTSGEHVCARECTWPPQPKTCSYVFTVEWLQSMSAACFDCPFNMTDCDRPGCIPINGVQRPIVVINMINRQLPGSPIQICEGDEIEVKVWDRLGNSEGTSIHWHGIHQRGTPYMDGAPMITQCPISAQSSFTYKFQASPAGTHWWHSHSGVQVHDGAYGALIVKQSPNRDVHSDLYDYDLPEHVVFIQDWYDEPTISRSAAFPPRTFHAESFIINGKGVSTEFTKDGENALTPRAVFNVKKGQRYRFRVISNAHCHMTVSVENHNLTVIATDGAPLKPVVVDRIGLLSGERYDFILNADKEADNYWFRVTSSDPPCRSTPPEFAILRYDGAPEEEPSSSFSDDGVGVILNPLSQFDPTGLNLGQLEAAVPASDDFLDEPDARFYFVTGVNVVTQWGMYDFGDYPYQRLSEFARPTRQLNYVSFKTPPSPLLTQLEDVPKDDFCDADETLAARDECITQYCTCTQTIKVELGQLVEIIFVGEDFFGADHPMHTHGYNFRVVAFGKLARGTTVHNIIQLDQQGNITRNLKHGIVKDTVPVQGDGYTIIRFVANNPGWWLFHCHRIYHVSDGMTIAVQVGEASDLPPIPDNFPTCGSWSPEDEDNHGYVKARKNGESGGTDTKSRKKP